MALSKLRKIAPLSAALVVGLINAIIGFIFAIIGLGISIFLARNPEIAATLVQGGLQNMLALSVTGSAWLILIYPVTGFISGFIGTLVVVWLYNLIARKVQLKVELK
ncbi:hypothetical protein J4433_01205 [Candidatus Pacearchaeota archaeon]|nr:hypothetical protein [Candidatus Pacearchaeota archaeon]